MCVYLERLKNITEDAIAEWEQDNNKKLPENERDFICCLANEAFCKSNSDIQKRKKVIK